MQVSIDLYLYHTSGPLLMQVFGPPPVKGYHFLVLFCILTCSCLLHPPHLMWTSGPFSPKQFIFLVCIWHISAPRLALTSHVVKSIHHNSHTTLLTSVWEPPRFVCLYYTELRASSMIYPIHVLVCSRATCSIHTTWMTFGPLSIVPTWGYLQCPLNRLNIPKFLLSSFLTPKRMKRLPSGAASFPTR